MMDLCDHTIAGNATFRPFRKRGPMIILGQSITLFRARRNRERN